MATLEMAMEDRAALECDVEAARAASVAYARPRHVDVARAVVAARARREGDLYLRPREVMAAVSLVDPAVEAALDAYAVAALDAAEARPPVPRVDAAALSAADFVERFVRPNEPVVIRGLVEDWPARRAAEDGGWLCADLRTVDVDAMERAVGAEAVPVQHCATRRTSAMPFCDFAALWRRGCNEHYLKDWHFRLDGHGGMASVPPHFADDWLSGGGLDYHFVYLGRAGTFTGLHCDVLHSYSWSANVAGAKRWLFLPPEQTQYLYDALGSDDFPRAFAPDGAAAEGRFPNLRRCRPVEVLQRGGDVVFVPSGWHHTVENVEDTLSVNCNWVNGHNAFWTLPRVAPEGPVPAESLLLGSSGDVTARVLAGRLRRAVDARPDDAFTLRRAGALAALLAGDAAFAVDPAGAADPAGAENADCARAADSRLFADVAGRADACLAALGHAPASNADNVAALHAALAPHLATSAQSR
ncbi:hypothetical protein M885DRAFT_535861 [Pelagophyceae sp. CCMP2097]|nr:hypothetical protein M885DRAFT_535861 [Pelagophyceae sp. CCMP2097]